MVTIELAEYNELLEQKKIIEENDTNKIVSLILNSMNNNMVVVNPQIYTNIALGLKKAGYGLSSISAGIDGNKYMIIKLDK